MTRGTQTNPHDHRSWTAFAEGLCASQTDARPTVETSATYIKKPEIVSQGTRSSDTDQFAHVVCPAGKRVVSGGGATEPVRPAFFQYMYRDNDGKGWRVHVRALTKSGKRFSVWATAVCADVSHQSQNPFLDTLSTRHLETQTAYSTPPVDTGSADDSQYATAYCPKGMRAISGSAQVGNGISEPGPAGVVLGSSFPDVVRYADGTSRGVWVASAFEAHPTTTRWRMTVTAVCAGSGL